MIHVCTPFALDKNLGRAYNEAFERCPDGDWLCLIDHDVMFLTPNSIALMYRYIEQFPEAGIFTCRTNRIHPLALQQLAEGKVSEDDSIRNWQKKAEFREHYFPKVTRILNPISGFLMLVSKETWKKVRFPETGKALGVDNEFSHRVLTMPRVILCMEAIIVWHTYRIANIKNKSHLL